MAIIKRYRSGGVRYQVKVKGSDGRWITDTYPSRAEAEKRQAELVVEKRSGGFVTNLSKQLTVAEYFETWSSENINSDASKGWKSSQRQMFRDYVKPMIGGVKLTQLNPGMVARVLNYAAELGRAPSTRLHIYGFLHKMFEDAVDLYELLPKNPAIRKLRPRLPVKEPKYLEIEEAIRLMQYVEGRPYQVAIWLQLLAGLRVGEVQYLRWENVDLLHGIIHVRGTYRRKEKELHDLPKGKKWHRVKMPPELWELLQLNQLKATSEFVAVSPCKGFMGYYGYVQALRRYCRRAGVPVVPTHGLRHSTAELYMASGATRDDLRILFAHSTNKMTDRYVHDKGRRLDEVAGNVILLRPRVAQQVSPKVPQDAKMLSLPDLRQGQDVV